MEQMVLAHIQKVTAYIAKHEEKFVQMLHLQDDKKLQTTIADNKKILSQSEKRIQELDKIIQRLYEDMVAGTLTNERFVKLSQSYEQEQIDLEMKVKSLQMQMNKELENRTNVDLFLSKVRKYTHITELSTIMLNELIERVEIHAKDKRYSRGNQIIKIRFNYLGDIGKLVLPPDPLPENPPEKIQIISAEKG